MMFDEGVPAPGLNCPACGLGVDWTTARFGRAFNCPHCRRLIRIPRSYTGWFAYPALVAGIALAAFTDVSWPAKIVAVIVLIAALNAVFSTAIRHIRPPTLQVVEHRSNESD